MNRDNRRETAKSHLELIKLPPAVIKLIHLFKSAQQQSRLAPNSLDFLQGTEFAAVYSAVYSSE